MLYLTSHHLLGVALALIGALHAAAAFSLGWFPPATPQAEAVEPAAEVPFAPPQQVTVSTLPKPPG
ncbi:hypothetical protein [Pseudooceanicola onchidii]|uniref:hypothetical protein n=1 Tax=Pseudooceanicola onchidii TaxID=2562279 RepID=UPI0010AAA85A|nr:hypothetical protein [Pseudooceanicola onchidii]